MDSSGSTAPLALVTGASSGIGRAVAHELAGRGHDLVVTSDGERLDAVAAELRSLGREVVATRADLATAEGVEHLWRQVGATGRPLDVAALNAGVGEGGAFATGDLTAHLRLVDLNVRSTVHLAGRVLEAMVARGRGRVLVTSSVAAVAPGPYQATYAASKAFVHSFAEAVAHELSGTGVTLTSVMPGPTDTDFFRRAGLLDTRMGQGPKDDPADVARAAVDALMAGKAHVRAGSLRTAVMAEVGTHLPDRLASALMATQTRPGTARHGDRGGDTS